MSIKSIFTIVLNIPALDVMIKHNIGRQYTKDIKQASVYVTLASNEDHNSAHKMILSALSHFFKIKKKSSEDSRHGSGYV